MRPSVAALFVCAFVSGCDSSDRYQIAASSQASAVWRVDTRTGEIQFCFFQPSGPIACGRSLTEAPFVPSK
jgi:hypothetical protein